MRLGRCWTGVGAVLLAIGLATAAEAAKYCADPVVESGAYPGTTQEEALLAAQRGWSSRAATLGPNYERWDNADDRALSCSKELDGTYQCQAAARPCLPDGMSPLSLPTL
ncbi:MAG: hypothetical protein AB7S70_02215 [Hyphomicrobium sp.]|uniref:hypothetical protein n=1 Tax=Hyphomicrobium sp. TaxID=82 RepID=UPI003D14B8AD